MSENQKLILPVSDTPTYINKDAVVGLVLGSFIPGLGNIAGMVIGAFLGKERMEKEKIQGKIISEPTALNKDTIIGAGIGLWTGEIIGLVSSLATKSFLPYIVLGAAGTAVGGMIGGFNGKHRMREEYQQAVVLNNQKIATQLKPEKNLENNLAASREAIPLLPNDKPSQKTSFSTMVEESCQPSTLHASR